MSVNKGSFPQQTETDAGLREMVFLPPATIGILGGGQLGRMLALEAREMGYRIVTMDPTENSPCGQVADRQIVAAFDSLEGARQLAQEADVLTYEFENIGAQMAERLEQESVLPQGYSLLYTIQNRLREKQAIERAKVTVAPYRPIRNVEDVDRAIAELGYPAVLKTTEGGYDGKGQWLIRTEHDLEQVKRSIKQTKQQEPQQKKQQQKEAQLQSSEKDTECDTKPASWVLEAWVPFQQEISCIVARNAQGECQTFPIAENVHQENILHLSIAPALISEEIRRQATQIAVRLAESFELIGLLAIEMFVLEEGTIYVNELAPRPHNSGHYTQQACHTSQFEQHLRAVCNLPLGDPEIMQPTVMVNILGEHLPAMLNKLPELGADYKVHLYGKKEAKPKRKMGHLNVLADDVESAIDKITALQIWNMEGIR